MTASDTPAYTVRLKALAAITGRTTHTIQNMRKLGQTPWDDVSSDTPAYTVRLKALSAITDRKPEAIRDMQKLGKTPWDDDVFSDVKQRRYSGLHALALVVAEGLTAQGLSFKAAGDAVRFQANILDLFLNEIELGLPVTPRFVSVIHDLWNDSLTSEQWVPLVPRGYGTADDLKAMFSEMVDHAGLEQDEGKDRPNRHLSGPWVAVQSIRSAYGVLQDRASKAGYCINGRTITASRPGLKHDGGAE